MLAVVFFIYWAQQQDPAVLSQRAKQALTAGQFEDAIRDYQTLLKANPGHPGLLLNLCIAQNSARHYPSAVQSCSKAVAAAPEMPPARIFLGLSYLKLNQPAKALPHLEKYHAANPQDPVGLLELADTYLTLDRPEQAQPLFEQLTNTTPLNPKAWQGLGLSHLALSRKVFEKLPEDSAAYLALLAKSKLEEQQFKAAYSLYRRALQKDPALPGAHAAIAEIYRRTDHADWAAAEEAKEPGTAPAGAYAEALRHSAAALAAFDRLAALPETPELLDLEARAERIRGRHNESISLYRRALTLRPADPLLERELARSLWLNRQNEEAIPLLRRLEMSAELGQALLESGDAAAALPFLESSVKAEPSRTDLRTALGRALLSLDQPAKSIPHLQQAAPADRDGSTHLQLSRALARAGRPVESKAAALKSAELSRKSTAPSEDQITPP